jgi:two-component system sensor histidine kinase YesM
MSQLVKIKKHSLRNRLVLLIIVVSIIPMGLMVIMGSFYYERIIKERFVENSQRNMDRFVLSLHTEVENMDVSTTRMLQDPFINDMLLRYPNTEDGSLDMFELRRDIRSYLSTVVFTKRNYDVGGIYFYGHDENIFYAKSPGLIQDREIPYLEMTEFIQDYKGSEFYSVQLDEHLNMYIVQQVLHKDTFEPIGVMYYRIDPNYLENIFSEGYAQTDETLFLYTKEGQLIAREGVINGEGLINDYDYYIADPDVYIHKYNGDEYYVITEDVPELNFSFITLISTRVLTQDSRKIVDLILILYAAIIPVFMLLSYALYQTILKPVNHLVVKMGDFEEGHFDSKIESNRKDEFGYLYEAFNNMTGNISSLVNDVYVKELARKDAELSALQEQINPHFLYNTLESINWRAQIAGEQDIALMIQALSKLMDASTNRDKKKLIPLHEEVSYIEQYMFLVKMRYEDSLTFIMEINHEVTDYLVPKLLIQPLLENAVKYGIEPVGEGTIKLLAYKEEDMFVIEVSDTGKGMNQLELRHMQDIVEVEKQSINLQKNKGGSVGLQNVTRRIQLIYGEKAEILIYSKEGTGTNIRLRLPELDIDTDTIS